MRINSSAAEGESSFWTLRDFKEGQSEAKAQEFKALAEFATHTL
jgi:hypothetical protein